ncbi:MAG: DUF4407 domain-containing protein [Chitinophagales bacterium]
MKLRKFFCTLSGADYSIIRKCSLEVQNLFRATGMFVFGIFIMCFISSYITFENLLHNKIGGIAIAIFFSWMITNIYLLLLYTLSKNTFPHIKNSKASLISIAMRLIFICFIAIIVAKPIEIKIYAIPLKKEIQNYKYQKIDKYTQSTISYFDDETNNLKLIIDKQKEISSISSDATIDQYQKLIKKKEIQKVELIHSMETLVNNSDFFLQRISILSCKYESCWLFTLAIIIIFLMPVYFKKRIEKYEEYFKIRSYIENRLVNDEYALFKEYYHSILINGFNIDIHYSETYIDPPFNTIRKKDNRQFLKEDDLISELYDA